MLLRCLGSDLPAHTTDGMQDATPTMTCSARCTGVGMPTAQTTSGASRRTGRMLCKLLVTMGTRPSRTGWQSIALQTGLRCVLLSLRHLADATLLCQGTLAQISSLRVAASRRCRCPNLRYPTDAVPSCASGRDKPKMTRTVHITVRRGALCITGGVSQYHAAGQGSPCKAAPAASRPASQAARCKRWRPARPILSH